MLFYLSTFPPCVPSPYTGFPPRTTVNTSMRFRDLFGVLIPLVCLHGTGLAEQAWKSKRIHDVFYAEGASVGDIDGDGHVDLVAGPLWYRGPDFEIAAEIAAAKSFPVEIYSDQFFSHVVDVNGDGHEDVIVIGFPGKPAPLSESGAPASRPTLGDA